MSEKANTIIDKIFVGLLAVAVTLGLGAAFRYFGMGGVFFFMAMALTAGLGGYEFRGLVDAVRSKTSAKNDGG